MVTETTPAGASFDSLYRECASDVFAYVMTLLRDRAAAEDVTQAAFERAYRKRSRFDARKGSQRAWLFGIARNAALDELRRRGRGARLEGEVADEDVGTDPAQVIADAQEREEELARRATVRAALATLEPRDRELIALKFFAGLGNAEIARVLDVSESNAGTRLHRAVNRLREACHA